MTDRAEGLRKLIDRLHDWTARKKHERLLARWGMTRQCPWCRQTVETDGLHKMREADHCAFFDTFTCGVCGGESHWEFGPVPLPRGIGAPPKPAQWAVDADRQTRALAEEE